MSHTPHHASPHGGRSLVRRVTTKLAVLAATLTLVLAGVLAGVLAPAGAASAARGECFVELGGDFDSPLVPASAGVKAGVLCADEGGD